MAGGQPLGPEIAGQRHQVGELDGLVQRMQGTGVSPRA